MQAFVGPNKRRGVHGQRKASPDQAAKCRPVASASRVNTDRRVNSIKRAQRCYLVTEEPLSLIDKASYDASHGLTGFMVLGDLCSAAARLEMKYRLTISPKRRLNSRKRESIRMSEKKKEKKSTHRPPPHHHRTPWFTVALHFSGHCI